MIHGLLESSETEKARAYTVLLVKDAVEYQSIVSVPYPAVRALLNHKLSAARDAGIAALKGSQRSIKADEENHGFGLENVEYLTKKHNGIFSIKQDNGFFEVNIALIVE